MQPEAPQWTAAQQASAARTQKLVEEQVAAFINAGDNLDGRLDALDELQLVVAEAYGADAEAVGNVMRAGQGISALVASINSDSEELQQMAMSLLGNLLTDVFDPKARLSLALFEQAGGLVAILEKLRSEYPINVFAVATLQNVTSLDPADTCATLRSMGCMAEVTALKESTDDEMVENYATAVLANLLLLDPTAAKDPALEEAILMRRLASIAMRIKLGRAVHTMQRQAVRWIERHRAKKAAEARAADFKALQAKVEGETLAAKSAEEEAAKATKEAAVKAEVAEAAKAAAADDALWAEDTLAAFEAEEAATTKAAEAAQAAAEAAKAIEEAEAAKAAAAEAARAAKVAEAEAAARAAAEEEEAVAKAAKEAETAKVKELLLAAEAKVAEKETKAAAKSKAAEEVAAAKAAEEAAAAKAAEEAAAAKAAEAPQWTTAQLEKAARTKVLAEAQVDAFINAADLNARLITLDQLRETASEAYGADAEAIATAVRDGNAITALTSSIDSDSPELQQMAMALLGNLLTDVFDSKAGNSLEMFAISGGLMAVQEKLRAEYPVNVFAAATLLNITSLDPDVTCAQLRVQGCAAVLTAMHEATDDETVVSYATAVLANLRAHDPGAVEDPALEEAILMRRLASIVQKIKMGRAVKTMQRHAIRWLERHHAKQAAAAALAAEQAELERHVRKLLQAAVDGDLMDLVVAQARALAPFTAEDDDELSIAENERVLIIAQPASDGWLVGLNAAGAQGLVPESYVEAEEMTVAPPPPKKPPEERIALLPAVQERIPRMGSMQQKPASIQPPQPSTTEQLLKPPGQERIPKLGSNAARAEGAGAIDLTSILKSAEQPFLPADAKKTTASMALTKPPGGRAGPIIFSGGTIQERIPRVGGGRSLRLGPLVEDNGAGITLQERLPRLGEKPSRRPRRRVQNENVVRLPRTDA